MFLVNIWNCWYAVLIEFFMHHCCWFVLSLFSLFPFFISLLSISLSACHGWIGGAWMSTTLHLTSVVPIINWLVPPPFANQSSIRRKLRNTFYMKLYHICAHVLKLTELNNLTPSLHPICRLLVLSAPTVSDFKFSLNILLCHFGKWITQFKFSTCFITFEIIHIFK